MLTVSTLASLAAKWLLPRLVAFQEAHPAIDVRITTSVDLVDFTSGDLDAAIRYGRGHWPGLRADWLMADRMFPVCSPALLGGERPLRRPEDLRDHILLHTSGASRDDWRLWLTAAGLPTDLSSHGGLTFDLNFVTVQAAIDGHGVAIGRTAYVRDDIAKGRLVVPFDITLPVEAGLYLVSPRIAPTRRNSRPSDSGCSTRSGQPTPRAGSDTAKYRSRTKLWPGSPSSWRARTSVPYCRTRNRANRPGGTTSTGSTPCRNRIRASPR